MEQITEVSVPRIEFETVSWDQPDSNPVSRRRKLASRGPYLAALPQPISELPIRLPPDLVVALEDVSNALSRFDAGVGNFSVPMAAVLLRTESAASSEVENITVSVKQLGLELLGKGRSVNAQLVQQNVEAMETAVKLSSSLGHIEIIEMQRVLLERSSPEQTGGYRQRQVWIGGFAPHVANFVPPQASRVYSLMEDLLRFIGRTDLPALAQIAIAHAQFETIHPFEDGNGRTGRALVQAMLKANGLTQSTTVPVSAGLLSDLPGYFRALSEFQGGNAAPIISAFIEATWSALANSQTLSNRLADLQERWTNELSLRSDAVAMKIIRILPSHPVLNAKLIVNLFGVSEPTAINGLVQLENSGVLTRLNSNARSRVWLATEVLEELEAFANRSRKRNPV